VAGIGLDYTTNTKVLDRGIMYRAGFDAVSLKYATNVAID